MDLTVLNFSALYMLVIIGWAIWFILFHRLLLEEDNRRIHPESPKEGLAMVPIVQQVDGQIHEV